MPPVTKPSSRPSVPARTQGGYLVPFPPSASPPSPVARTGAALSWRTWRRGRQPGAEFVNAGAADSQRMQAAESVRILNRFQQREHRRYCLFAEANPQGLGHIVSPSFGHKRANDFGVSNSVHPNNLLDTKLRKSQFAEDIQERQDR